MGYFSLKMVKSVEKNETQNRRSGRSEDRSPPPHARSLDARPAQEIEFGRIVETSQVVAIVKAEDLPLGKVCQVGEDSHGLLPMVANPGQRKKRHVLAIAAQSFHEALGFGANARRISGHLGAVACNAGCNFRGKSSPELGQAWPIAEGLVETEMAVQVAFKLQAQQQHFLVGQVDSVTLCASNGLEHEVLCEPAVGMAAKAYAPGDTAAAVTGQPQGALPETDRLVVK
jgi:hypothetical protein